MNDPFQPMRAAQAPQQPVQPQVPQQPAQVAPQTGYSSEPAMNTNAGDDTLYKFDIHLDKEAMNILQEVSPVHAESIVSLAIKLFSKTNIYKEFMLKPDFKSLDNKTEELQEMTEVSAGKTASVTNTSAPKTSSTPAAGGGGGGFASW